MEFWKRLTGKHEQLEIAVMVCLVFLFLSLRRPIEVRGTKEGRRSLQRWLVFLAAVCAIALVSYCVQFLLRWTYYDHTDPTIIVTARLLDHGFPLYHDLDAPSRYTFPLYGPATYLAPLYSERLLGTALVSAKLPAVLFSLTSVVLVVVAIRRTVRGMTALAVGLLYFCGLALLFRPFPVMVRVDAQMMFWVAVSVAALTVRSAVFSLALLGLAAGSITLTKVHGILYLAPVAAVVLARSPRMAWVIVPTIAGAIACLPFLVYPEISFANYLMWLRKGAGHGIDLWAAPRVLGGAMFVTVPVFLGVQKCLRALPDEERAQLVRAYRLPAQVGIGALVIVVALAMKAGAGMHHLMPFLPLAAYVTALAYSHALADGGNDERLVVEVAMAAALVLPAMGVALGSFVVFVAPQAADPVNVEALAELREVVRRHPGETIAMGYGEPASYEQTFLRTELPLQGKLIVDPAALMDMRQMGIPLPEATIQAIERGAVRIWLLPHDEEPFRLRNFYNGDDVFGPEFREVFTKNYRLEERGLFFDVWRYVPRREG
jgi:hypothetical protein